MSTWADPIHDTAKAQRLADILADGRGYPASDPVPFWDLVGDDGFHDLLLAMAKADPSSEARHAAASWVAGWLADGPGRWFKPWDDEAVRISAEAVEAWQAAHPDKAILPKDYQSYFDQRPAASLN